MTLKDNDGVKKKKSLWTKAVLQTLDHSPYISKLIGIIQPALGTGKKSLCGDSLANGRTLVLLSVDRGTDSAPTWCWKEMMEQRKKIFYGQRQYCKQ